MICQLCLARVATRRVTERLPSGRLGDAYYCPDCYGAKYLGPGPAGGGGAPRLRLTLGLAMTLVGVWGVANALTAWVIKAGSRGWPPAQAGRWAARAFLGVNLSVGLFAGYVVVAGWLSRLLWHRRTGGLVPMPAQTPGFKGLAALSAWLASFMLWGLAAAVAAQWLTRAVWPSQRINMRLFALVLWVPILSVVAARLWGDRFFRDQVWQEWRVASASERAWRGVALAWSLGFVLLFVAEGPRVIFWGVRAWFLVPPFLLVGVVGQAALVAAVAWATRPR